MTTNEAADRRDPRGASVAVENVVVLWVALVRLDASVDRSRYG
jgi:hypothetical protein